MRRTGLLSEQETVTLLQGDTVTGKTLVLNAMIMHNKECRYSPRVLVIGGEAGRVGGLGDLAVLDLL
jgi:hypothetical protein